MSTDYVGFCDCGCIATANCKSCGRALCDDHARAYPDTPNGVSEYAQIQFARAVRLVGGIECESCRAEKGRVALQQAASAPLEPLPDHWLDRAVALRSDQSRSPQEKRSHGQLPAQLTAWDVAQEFVRRINREPRDRAQLTKGTVLRKAEFVMGWKVNCRHTEFTQHYPDGTSERQPLPVMITPDAGLLGPVLEDGDQQSATWHPLYEHDIDLPKLVDGVADILRLSYYG